MYKGTKYKTAVGFVVISVVALMSIVSVRGAVDWTKPYNNLSSGYRVTTENFPNSVGLGEPVVAWAGTTNGDIDEVKFRWNPPDGSGLDSIVIIGTPEGSVFVDGVGTVYQWSSTYTPIDPDALGDWGVQALFYDNDSPGSGVGPIACQAGPVRIIARSFFVVPEAALGTIAVLASMMTAFAIFRPKKKSHL
jgi:hypothetical protein